MKELELEQGTREWLEARKGKITGTRLASVLKTDNLPVIYEMIAELGSDEVEETFVNKVNQYQYYLKVHYHLLHFYYLPLLLYRLLQTF